MITNKKTYIIIGIAVVVVIVALFLMRKFSTERVQNEDTSANPASGKLVTGSDLETFSGTISAVDTGCFSDAVCSVTVDGKKIILVQGGRGLAPDTVVGKLIGVDSIGDLEGRIGSFANVYAGLTPDGDYTLYGNSNYYVEVTMISGK